MSWLTLAGIVALVVLLRDQQDRLDEYERDLREDQERDQ